MKNGTAGLPYRFYGFYSYCSGNEWAYYFLPRIDAIALIRPAVEES